MQSGRLEHREAVNIAARLRQIGTPALEDTVCIENISINGARVITHHKFRRRVKVVLTEVSSALQIDGEVVYCEHLNSVSYAVGLKFLQSIPSLLQQRQGYD